MNQIKTALSLLPLLHVLYEAGVIDICPSLSGDNDYIQLNVKTFKTLFPYVTLDDEGRYITYLENVQILAVNP